MATLLTTDGRRIRVIPRHEPYFSLKELQGLVGGDIQLIPLGEGKSLVLNEDGKILDLPRNEQATGYGILAGIRDDDFIVGNALIVSDGELEP